MLCKKCNAQLPEAVRFCPYCGEKVTVEQSNETTMQGDTRKKQQEYIGMGTEKAHSDYSKQKKFLVAGGMLLFAAMFVILGANILKERNLKQTSNLQMAQETIQGSENLKETPENAPTPTPLSFENKIRMMNETGNVLQEIAIYEENYNIRQAGKEDCWDYVLFETLEGTGDMWREPPLLDTYNREAKALRNKDTGNVIEYILYRNPITGKVNKIVSIEMLENGEIETVEYYFTDDGKVNFVFFHRVTEYTPSYATQDKPGERYYYADDAMTKWRVVPKDNPSENKRTYVVNKKQLGEYKKDKKWCMLKDASAQIQDEFQKKAERMLNAAYNTYHAVVDMESINRIDGCVVDEYEGVIQGATVRLFAENKTGCLFESTTDELGMYQLYIPSDAYTYYLEIEKEGFLKEKIYNIKPTGEIIELVQENACLFRNGKAGYMYFSLRHAFKDDYLYDAIIRVRKGINNRYGEIYRTLNYIQDESTGILLEPGNYTLEIVSGNYQTAYKNIRFELDGVVRILLSPTLNEGEVRIVLDWGAEPNDLDAHLFTPYDGENSVEVYHIWYGNQEDPYDNNLDVDDTDGFGPETMTIRNLKNGCYKYYVADYTNCSDDNPTSYEMSHSGAQVNVYTSDGNVQTFYVPINRSGVIWEVFEIRNGKINPINHYYNQIEDKEWWHQEK
ncbi:MAG: zinc-ribbon domain-containing protein [Lachnospiraceae bacterium]|nr:zinc-ribbon domain-containing protein [Lachnospiraceae bacterium]